MLTEYFVNIALLGAEWVLYLLVILSVISIALVVERLLMFHRTSRCLWALEARWMGLHGGDASMLEGYQGSTECKLIASAGTVADAQVQGHTELNEAVLSNQIQGLSNTYRRHLSRFTAFLGTLGNNAPFIGLFGTVIGVIGAFDALQESVEGGAGDVMSGISEALVATAAGIAVAIPAVVAYNFFVKLVDEYVERFELVVWSKVRSGEKK